MLQNECPAVTGCVTLGKSYSLSKFVSSFEKKKRLILPSKVFQGRRNQMTDVCERASGTVEANKIIGD